MASQINIQMEKGTHQGTSARSSKPITKVLIGRFVPIPIARKKIYNQSRKKVLTTDAKSVNIEE